MTKIATRPQSPSRAAWRWRRSRASLAEGTMDTRGADSRHASCHAGELTRFQLVRLRHRSERQACNSILCRAHCNTTHDMDKQSILLSRNVVARVKKPPSFQHACLYSCLPDSIQVILSPTKVPKYEETVSCADTCDAGQRGRQPKNNHID